MALIVAQAAFVSSAHEGDAYNGRQSLYKASGAEQAASLYCLSVLLSIIGTRGGSVIDLRHMYGDGVTETVGVPATAAPAIAALRGCVSALPAAHGAVVLRITGGPHWSGGGVTDGGVGKCVQVLGTLAQAASALHGAKLPMQQALSKAALKSFDLMVGHARSFAQNLEAQALEKQQREQALAAQQQQLVHSKGGGGGGGGGGSGGGRRQRLRAVEEEEEEEEEEERNGGGGGGGGSGSGSSSGASSSSAAAAPPVQAESDFLRLARLASRVLLLQAQRLVGQGSVGEAGAAISRTHAAYSKARIPLLSRVMHDIHRVLVSEGTGGARIALPDVAGGVPNTFVSVEDLSGLREFVVEAIASDEVLERERAPLAAIYDLDAQVAKLLDTKAFQDGTVKLYGSAGTYVTSVRELLPGLDGQSEAGREWRREMYVGSFLDGLLTREEERNSDAAKLAEGKERETDTLARIFARIKKEVGSGRRDPKDFEVTTAYVEFQAGELPGGGLFYARGAEAQLGLDFWDWLVNENANFVTLRGSTMLDPAKAAEMG